MKSLPQARPASPIFPRVAIIGVGLVGGSVAMAVRRTWPASLVIGIDRKPMVERAMLAHAIDVGADDIGMAADADLIVLAAPVAENERILRGELAAHVPREAVVTDVGSVKRGIDAAAGELPGRLAFVGGHPLAGAARGGLDHAEAVLFSGRPWVLCPREDGGLHRVDEFVAALGARPRVMDPAAHDRLVAFLSHLPQLTASALMAVVGETAGEEGLALAGLGLQDTTRLAASPADIWKDVCAANADNIGAALDALVSVLQELRRELTRGEALERVFASAQHWKQRTPS